VTTYSFFASNPTPAGGTTTDSAVSLGVTFATAAPGEITAVRFHAPAGFDGSFTVGVFIEGNATALTTEAATGVSAGWNTVALSTPVAVSPGTSYIAVVHTSGGSYSFTSSYGFPVKVPPLYNSVTTAARFTYGGSIAEPTTATQTNFWVDPVLDNVGSYVDEVLADTPKVYYRMGEASGTTAYNGGSLTTHGTYVNTPLLGETGAISGDSDKAVYFDRTQSEYLNSSYTATDLGINGNHDLTVECWWRRNSAWTGNFGTVWGLGSASGGQALYVGYVGGLSGRPDGRYEIGVYGGLCEFDIADDAIEFHHIAVRFNAATDVVDIRVDGAAATLVSGSGSVTLNLGNGATFQAARLGLTGDYASGWLDEIAVYDTRLSDSRIQAHYDAGTGAAGGGDLTGTIAAATTVSGTLSGSGALSGTSAASSGATGTLRGLVPVTGTIAAATTVSGTLSGSGSLSGASAATSSAAATLRGIAPLSGTSAAATTVSGDLTGTGSLSGSSAASSTVSGVLSSPADLSGTIAASSGASGTLGGSGALSANSAASSGASGSLSSADTLAGGSAASSGLSGTLTGSGALAGVSAATSGATGSLSSPAGLTGTVSILSGASATLGAIASGTGTAAAVSDSSASLSGLARSSGTVAIVSGLTGTIGAIGRLSGTILVTSGATATFFGAPPANGRTDADAATGRSAASTVAGRGPRHPRYGW
jgi:hypothetical protein